MTSTTREHHAADTTVWLIRAIVYVVYAFLIFTEIVLIQGFLLKLLGANASADYTQWAYRSLDRVMEPFRGIFTPIEIDGNAVLDTSILFAMIIYGIVALLVSSLLDWLSYRLERMERQRQAEAAMHAAQQVDPYGVPAGSMPMPTAATHVPPAASGGESAP